MGKELLPGIMDPLDSFIRTNVSGEFSLLSEDTDPYFIINLSGEIFCSNKACQTLLGYSNEELLEMSLKDVCHEMELNKHQTYFIKDNREKLTSFYIQVMKKNGTFLDVDATCFPIFHKKKVIGTYIVLRKAQGMVVQREQYFKKIIEESPDPIFILKGRTIVEVSNIALSMFGVTDKKELMGESILCLVDFHSQELFNDKIELVSKGQITDLFEPKMLKVNNDTVDVEAKGFPIVFKGEPACYLLLRDISERKMFSIISEKQAVAGQLAAGIAHEIRNPITAIKGFLQLLKGEDYKKQKSYFRIIESEIERIELILKELMVLAKPNSIKQERVEIGALIEQVLTLMNSQALLHNIVIENINHNGYTNVQGDANQLKQVFINYIKNAIEAMPNGGRILVESYQTENNHVRIRFIDEGGGIPPEIRDRIGELFLTTKDNGTGLGMAVSNHIIKEHKGLINIFSDKNGTCIEVELPIMH